MNNAAAVTGQGCESLVASAELCSRDDMNTQIRYRLTVLM
jgi:hypothetical protein